MTVGMVCGAVGLALLTQIDADSSYGALLPGYLLFGISLGLVYAPMSTAAMLAMPHDKAGIAAGVLAMVRVTAGALSLRSSPRSSRASRTTSSTSTPGTAGPPSPPRWASRPGYSSAWSRWVRCSTWALVRRTGGDEPQPPEEHPEHRQERHRLHLSAGRGEGERHAGLKRSVLPNVDEIATVVVCEDDDATRELLC